MKKRGFKDSQAIKVLAITIFAGVASIMYARDVDFSELVPPPQQIISEGTAFFSYRGQEKLQFQVSAAGAEEAQKFAEQMERLLGRKIELTVISEPGIQMLCSRKNYQPLPYKPHVPDQACGYALRVTERGIEVMANDKQGFYYGLQTLLQMFLLSAEQGGGIPAGVICDWPGLQRRAVMINLDGTTSFSKFDEKMFAVLGALKINHVFFFVERSLPGDKYFKNVNPLTQAQAEKLKAMCRKHYLTVNLAFQLGGHMSWVLVDKNYSNMLESSPANPSLGYMNANTCPNSPEFYEMFEEMIARQCRIFDPEYVHIGYDEVHTGNIKTCPRCLASPLDKNQLVAQGINRIDALIKKYSHARTLIWYDQLMSQKMVALWANNIASTDGEKILDNIPKDIEIAMWRYDGRTSAVPQMNYFREKGHPVWIAATCDSGSGDRRNTAQLAHRENLEGNILTTWYTVNSWLASSAISLPAMAGTVEYAAAVWKPQAAAQKISMADPVTLFRLLVDGVSPVGADRNFAQIELPASSLPQQTPAVIRELLAAIGSRPVKSLNEGIQFSVTSNSAVLSGAKDDGLPGRTLIPFAGKIKALHFLHTCNQPDARLQNYHRLADRPEVARYRLISSDNTVTEIPVRYRSEIVNWNNRFSGYNSPTALIGEFLPGADYRLTSYTWRPGSNKALEIKGIELISSNASGMNPVLLAVTAELDAPAPAAREMTDIVWQDNFEYADTSELRKVWNYTKVPELCKGEESLSGRAMQFTLPASKEQHRTDVGWTGKEIALTQDSVLSFQIWIDLPPDMSLIDYIYLGNPEKGYHYEARIGFSKEKMREWQKIVIPVRRFGTADKIPPGFGLNKITLMKISFYHKTGKTGIIRIADFKIGTPAEQIYSPTN